MTPEQILTLRPIFERGLIARGTVPESLELHADGFRYKHDFVDDQWEGFLMAADHFQDTVKVLEMFSKDVKSSEYMEQLRQMRAYSKCFTGAYDKKEPVFVLRAQDKHAFKALAQWLMSVKDVLGESNPKYIAAKATLGTFLSWENQKEPD